MAHQAATPSPGPGVRRPASTGNSAWAAGGVTFAGVLMLINGVLAALQGIAAIAENDVYARMGDYVYKINLTGWGWILVVLGAMAAVVGWGILSGAGWARATGIAIASLHLVAQFLFLPYQPVWAVVMMALDVFILWALAVYRPESDSRT